jgi:hypothetical protein
MFWRSLGALFIASLLLSSSAAQQTFQQLEVVSEFERALAAIDAIRQRKKLQCVIATANGPLCGCLSRMLPVDTFIRNYDSLTTQGSSGEYGQLSAVDKEIVTQCLNESR